MKEILTSKEFKSFAIRTLELIGVIAFFYFVLTRI
jgi:hypothetical protein